MSNVTVIIPTFNEEQHLTRCLRSAVRLTDQVYVVDSFSTDATRALARRFHDRGVVTVQHAYAGPAQQKNWALEHLPIATDWVLFLDADEALSEELVDEVARTVDRRDNPVCGYFIRRRIIWFGRWIRFGGWYPSWNLRLFRHGSGRYEERRVHEHMRVDGPTAALRHDLIHEDLRDLSHSIAKHNRYSSLEAQEYQRILEGRRDGYACLWSRDPLARRRWLKTRIFARLPGKMLWYFLWSYVLRLGFLDGLAGLRYHSLQAVYRHFDELKLWELRRQRPRPAVPAVAEVVRPRRGACAAASRPGTPSSTA